MQIEHKTEKGTLLLLKLSDNESALFADSKGLHYMDNTMFSNMPLYKELPKGDWQLIGLTSEVTEEQAKMMVHAHIEDDGNVYGYFDYPQSDTIKDTALDSFKSLMQHLQVYEINPYKKPNANDYKIDSFTDSLYLEDMEHEYLEAQSRTGKWIVLFKPNE